VSGSTSSPRSSRSGQRAAATESRAAGGAAPAPSWRAHALDLLAACPRLRDPEERGRLTGAPVNPTASDLEELATVKLDSLVYLARDPAAPRQRLYDAVWQVQREAAREALASFAAAGVATIVFKGAELLERYYRPHGLSFAVDYDVLVERESLVEAQRILFGLGYRPAVYRRGEGLVDRDIGAIATIESGHYQLPSFMRVAEPDLDRDIVELARELGETGDGPLIRDDDRLVVVVECDVHHRVAADVDTGPLFERAVPSALGAGSTLGPADHLWFTLSRLYVEVALHRKRSLRDFAYLLPLVAEGGVDWSVVLESGVETELRPHLFYFLSFMRELLGGGVPAEVLDALEPTRGGRDHDWGWQLGKLFSTVEPSPLPAIRDAP
jgi:hypothetical protein